MTRFSEAAVADLLARGRGYRINDSTPAGDAAAAPSPRGAPAVRGPSPWTADDDAWLRANYPAMGKVAAAAHLGRSLQAVRTRASRLGLKQDRESAFFKDWQSRAAQSKVGKKRPEHSAALKGRPTTPPSEGTRARMSAAQRARFATGAHPRGAAGMKHSDVTRQAIGEKSRARWASMSEDERAAHTEKQMRAKDANGSLHTPRPNASWKAGWREIGGQRVFFRSRWEANYARYLEMLRKGGAIDKWEHEPETFWFTKIKRGTRSYLPDFRVTEGGAVSFHEVKGWMDERSRTQIRRMAKYHPTVRLVVVDRKAYEVLAKKWASHLAGWE